MILAADFSGMLARNVTHLYFVVALSLALVTTALPLVLGPWLLLLTLGSFLFSIWALHRSDGKGFVKSTQIRRAFEPARHFNGAQVFVLFGVLVVQAAAAAYVLLR